MTVWMGNCSIVLNKYRLKLIKEKMLFKIEGGRFSFFSFHPNNTIRKMVIKLNAKIPMLMDVNILGFCSTR